MCVKVWVVVFGGPLASGSGSSDRFDKHIVDKAHILSMLTVPAQY